MAVVRRSGLSDAVAAQVVSLLAVGAVSSNSIALFNQANLRLTSVESTGKMLV